MIKRYFDSETYRKIGSPDLGSKMFLPRGGKRIYGKVSLLKFTSEKGKHNGKILLGIVPFNKLKE